MKKHTLVKAISILAASALTVSMASGFAPSATKAKLSVKSTTVTVLASQDWVRDAEKTLAKNFQKKTGIKIDYQIVPASQYTSVLKTKLNAGECADIFMTQSGKFDIVSQFNIAKNAVSLSKESWVSREDVNVRDQASVNGKLYGLTIWDTAPVYPVVYNKVIFKKLGLSTPKTYKAFTSVCSKILKSGVTPVYEPGADGWHLALWYLDIGPIYAAHTKDLVNKLNNNKLKFSGNASMKRALVELSDIVKAGYFGKNFLSQTFANTQTAMASGEYAMTLDGLNTPKSIATVTGSKYKESNFGFFEIPIDDNNIIDYGTAAPTKFIYKGSKHIKQAKQFFDFLTTKSNLQYYLNHDNTKVSLCFSGVKSTANAEAKKFLASTTKRGVYLQNQVKYLNTQWGDVDKDLQAMYVGSLSPAQLLKNIDSRRTSQAQAAKDSKW